MDTKAVSSDDSQQKRCADSNGMKTNDDNKGKCAETTTKTVSNVEIGKILAENSLDQSYWQPIFENQLKITSHNQIKFLGTKDYLSIKGHCRSNWEEKALETLLCGNKDKSDVLTLDDWKERERSDQIRINDRQECVNKTKSNLPKSEDWKNSSKNEDFNKKFDGIIPQSTNQTTNVLRQHLDEISVLKNASAGMAVSGILIKHIDIENTNKVVIDIVGDICMKAPQRKQCEQVFDFSTKQKHDAYRQSMETFASSGNISVKAASSLDKRILYSYMNDKDEKSTLHVEHFFHSRIHHAFVPVKACELKLENFIFVPDALNSLKDIEKLYLEKKDFDTLHSLFVKFFKDYGSHVNVGKLHFGGIYEWTAKYESEHMSKENFTIDIVNHVLNAYVSGSKTLLNKHVGGTISGDVIKKETNFNGNYDESELSKVLCEISIYGGPPEAGTFDEWKSRLTSENSTWNIIHRNEFIGIWEILSNHQTGFQDYSKLSKLMEVSYHVEYFFDTTSSEIQQCKFQSVLCTFQDIIRIVCQDIGNMDYIIGMMNLKFIQDLFSHMIFITKNSTDEYFVLEVKASMETIVKYMKNVDNPVKRSIVSWIGDPHSTQTQTSGLLTRENIQDVESLLSALRDKFLPFVNTQRTKHNDKELNEYVKEELTKVCLRLLSSLKKTNVFHYAILLSQLQILNYDVKNYLFPDFQVFDGLVDLTNDLESCIEVYRMPQSHNVKEQAFVVGLIISNMGKYKVSNKEVVFDQCLHPVRPMLHDEIVETLKVCTDKPPYQWSRMNHRMELLTNEDDIPQYRITFSDKTCHEQINQTGFDNKLYRLSKSATHVLEKLGLSEYFPNKLDFIEAISIPIKTSNELNVHSLPKMVLNDIMMVNRVARDHNLLNYLKCLKTTNKQRNDDSEDSDDEDDDDDDDDEEEDEVDINPLDMLVAIFYCSSYTLQQAIADKFFSCCIAIPFVFPPNENNDLILLLGTLRAIVVNLKSECVMYKKTAVDIPCHVLSFIRLGRPHFSKSSMINNFMSSVDCKIFFNRDCPLGKTQRELSNGLIELSLFPTTRTDFMFALNLRGDGLEFENSVKLLSGISSVVVVCLEAEHLNNAQSLERLTVINDCAKGVVLALDGNMLNGKEMKPLHKKFKDILPSERQNKTSIINIRLQNELKDLSKIKDAFHKMIGKHFKGQPPSKMVDRIHNLQFDALFVDEDCFNVREKENASLVLLDLPHSFTDLKKTILPLQTTILPDISANFKKMYSACNIIALKQNDIRQELLQLREKQLQIMCNLHPFMKTFISKLLQYEDKLEQVNIFALCLKSYLDDRCRDNIQLQKNEFKDVFNDERRLNNRRTDLAFGFGHLMREVAQIFESCSALKSQCEENTWTRVSKYPAFAAQFLLKGQPVEVMDGDTGYVPLEWIKAIIKELGEKLHDNKCMVLSIIGIQSTGKSTLLNTMFGLTFPVCAGRCTKGVFMQIIPVSRDDFQYILVLDTEGLRAPTKGIDMNTIDNEIATFAIGLSDINIVNIKGESTSEMREVMSMAICSLLRLKLGNQNININQTCLFVHQNVSDENAHEMTKQERNILTSELDSMTAAAAEHINNYEIKKISDVIKFDPHENVCYIPDLWTGVDKMKYISSGYSLSVAKLKEKIMKFASSDKNYLPFSNLILRVHDIWTGILGDSFVFDFSSSLSLKAYDEMIKQFQELKWNLHRIGENELNQAENLLFATNENYNEFAEKIKSQLDESMKTEQTKHMLTFNEFIDNSHLKNLMKHWRLIFTEKLLTEQEKIIWTLRKDYEKLVERVKLKREQSLRQTEYEKELMKMVKNLSGEERKNKDDLEKRFDEHWTLWSKKLIPGLHTSLPSLTDTMHQLVNENCDDKIKSYVKEYMSQPENESMKQTSILLDSLTFDNIDISILNVKQHRIIFKTNKYKDTDCKKDAMLLINIIFSEIDVYLGKTIKYVSQFEDRFALMSFSFISKNIDSFQSEKFTISPKFHALLLSHVAKYLIIYFTRVHKKEEEKQRKFRKQQQELMYQFVSNVAESNNAANYFLKALSVGMIEHVSTKIPGDIADLIVKEFGHSKHKVIKNILLDLAEKDQFYLFKMYIDEPRDYANFWTIRYVNTKLFAFTEGTTLTLYSKIAKKLLSQVSRPLKTGIIIASRCCSKSLQNNSSWIDTFTQEMMKAKVFPLKPENIQFLQKHVTDFETFSDALLDKFDSIINNILSDFSKTTETDIEWKECPYTKILDELWGCVEKCPFCSETCIHPNKNHLEMGAKHRCWMHRPQGIGDVKSTESHYVIFKRDVLEVENCNFLIGTSRTYKKTGFTGPKKKFCDFRNDYIDWEIKADGSTRPEYWMWFFCEYGHNLEMVNGGVELPTIPENRKVKKEIAIKSLDSAETY